MNDANNVVDLIEALENPFVKKVTSYINKNKTIKITRIAYKNKPNPKNAKQECFLLTIGKPNFNEKKFIKKHSHIIGFGTPVLDVKFFPKKKSSR